MERLAEHVKNVHPQTDGGTSKEDARLAKRYENPQFGEFKEPATVLDQHGHIILWHLPFIFSHYRMVNTFCFFVILNPQYLTDPQSDLSAATVAVRRPLDSFMKSLHRNSKTPSWRHSLFDPPSGGGIFGAGVLNMSPGWFQQSQDVSFITDLSFFLNAAYLYIILATFRFPICFY